jgi:transposase
LACGSTDLRKSIDSLAVLVQEGFELNPFAPALFVFYNRQRDKLKILQWEHNGFWLQFQWPSQTEPGTITVDPRQLRWLLDGLSLAQKQAHPEVAVQIVV